MGSRYFKTHKGKHAFSIPVYAWARGNAIRAQYDLSWEQLVTLAAEEFWITARNNGQLGTVRYGRLYSRQPHDKKAERCKIRVVSDQYKFNVWSNRMTRMGYARLGNWIADAILEFKGNKVEER